MRGGRGKGKKGGGGGDNFVINAKSSRLRWVIGSKLSLAVTFQEAAWAADCQHSVSGYHSKQLI